MNAHVREWSVQERTQAIRSMQSPSVQHMRLGIYDGEMRVLLQMTQEELVNAGFMTTGEMLSRIERAIEACFVPRAEPTPLDVIQRVTGRRIVL